MDTPVSSVPSHLAPTLERAHAARVEAFVRQYYAFVWRVLRRSGLAPADADDAAQRVFLIAADRIGDILKGSERAFLYRTAARVAANSRRSDHRRRDLPGLEETAAATPFPAPDDLLDQRRARELLDRVLGELPEDLRAILVLFELEELRTPEIAEALDIPLGTVASRLRRARAEVQERVERYRKGQRGKGALP